MTTNILQFVNTNLQRVIAQDKTPVDNNLHKEIGIRPGGAAVRGRYFRIKGGVQSCS